jgi:hypothetical protein
VHFCTVPPFWKYRWSAERLQNLHAGRDDDTKSFVGASRPRRAPPTNGKIAADGKLMNISSFIASWRPEDFPR